MTANAADFAGSGCGRRYEKELETHFRDCLLFYLDGRIRFERYCYGGGRLSGVQRLGPRL